MKRVLLPASALVLVLSACGGSHTAAPRVTKVKDRLVAVARPSPAERKAAAARKAEELLDAFRPPRGARPLRHGTSGYRWPSPDKGIGIVGKRVDRHRVWLLHRSVTSFEPGLEGTERPGWNYADLYYTEGDRSLRTADETFTARGFGGRRAGRMLNLAAVRERHGHGTLLRVDVAVAWQLSAAQRENLPPRVAEIDISGRRPLAQASDPAQVRTIVGWFDRLPIDDSGPHYCTTPSLVVGEPPFLRSGDGGPTFTFIFRNAHGTALARASFPPTSTFGFCDPSPTYRIGGHSVKPLLDGDIAFRVQELLGANWIGPPDMSVRASGRAWAAARRASS